MNYETYREHLFDLLVTNENLKDEIEKLQGRIVKATKHIEALKEFDELNFGGGAYSKDWEELLEILKGDSNE